MSLFSTYSVVGYVGPGLAGGAIVAIMGFLVSIGVALVGVVWYPLKHLIRKLLRRDNE